ncbi:hypothetical protein M407DRAFT_86020 [Tulasnella calospora MUT 4182]|uniref:Uncharacterized protein n=1 Tax=Tulasnella calospora MUT 4182 TaxID=1051891 RepID=A0A0C3K4X0_9AGAM|nr:hypothetical protein M407DRAFT_86020 [Tulasnella calospora MUT 4182]
MNSEKPVPYSARTGAFLKPTFSGRLFTLLPLPIFTHFPLHIHATLALTSSRQNLRNAQENVTDPKSRYAISNDFPSALLMKNIAQASR